MSYIDIPSGLGLGSGGQAAVSNAASGPQFYGSTGGGNAFSSGSGNALTNPSQQAQQYNKVSQTLQRGTGQSSVSIPGPSAPANGGYGSPREDLFHQLYGKNAYMPPGWQPPGSAIPLPPPPGPSLSPVASKLAPTMPITKAAAPTSTPTEQRGQAPSPTGAVSPVQAIANFIGGLFGLSGVSPAQTKQAQSTQQLQAKSLPTSAVTPTPSPSPTPQPGFAPQSVADPTPLGLTGQRVHSGSWGGLLDVGLTEGIQQWLRNTFGMQGQRSTGGGSTLHQELSPAGASGAFDLSTGSFLGPTGQQIKKGANQTGKQLSPTANTAQQKQQLVNWIQNPAQNPSSSVATNLANEGGVKLINQQIDTAQKAGDFDTVARLTDLGRAAQQNMVFQNQINAIMSALASSFGTNTAQLTAQRQPMVQQGVFQGLETPPQQQMTYLGGQPQQGQPMTFFPNQLREFNPNQQTNITPQFPTMSGQLNTPYNPQGGYQINPQLYGKSQVA